MPVTIVGVMKYNATTMIIMSQCELFKSDEKVSTHKVSSRIVVCSSGGTKISTKIVGDWDLFSLFLPFSWPLFVYW